MTSDAFCLNEFVIGRLTCCIASFGPLDPWPLPWQEEERQQLVLDLNASIGQMMPALLIAAYDASTCTSTAHGFCPSFENYQARRCRNLRLQQEISLWKCCMGTKRLERSSGSCRPWQFAVGYLIGGSNSSLLSDFNCQHGGSCSESQIRAAAPNTGWTGRSLWVAVSDRRGGGCQHLRRHVRPACCPRSAVVVFRVDSMAYMAYMHFWAWVPFIWLT